MSGKITQGVKPLNRMSGVGCGASPSVRAPGRDCRMSAMAESALFETAGSSHHEGVLLNVYDQHRPDLAPQQLVEIVPKVVDIVRRYLVL